MTIRGGALISSSTYGSGNAGQITLNASESIEITGSGFFATTHRVELSKVQTSGRLLSEAILQIFGLPDIVSIFPYGVLPQSVTHHYFKT